MSLLTTVTRSLSRRAAIVRPLSGTRFESTRTASAHPLAKTESDASSSHGITIAEPGEVLTAEVVSGAPREWLAIISPYTRRPTNGLECFVRGTTTPYSSDLHTYEKYNAIWWCKRDEMEDRF